VFGCPVYVLNKTIADGKKIPRWQPRSIRSINVGLSPCHATTIPLVLNPSTGAITPQFNVVFDDWFATIAASSDELPDFNSDAWARMFGTATFCFPFDEGDEEIVEARDEPDKAFQDQRERVREAMDAAHLPAAPLAPTPPTTNVASQRTPALQREHSGPSSVQREHTAPAPRDLPEQRERSAPDQSDQLQREQLFAPLPSALSDPSPTGPLTPPTPPDQRPVLPQRSLFPVLASPAPPQREITASAPTSEPRRTTRVRKAPNRHGFDGSQGSGYYGSTNDSNSTSDSSSSSSAPLFFPSAFLMECTGCAYSAAAKKKTDPDTLNWDQAIADTEHQEAWLDAAKLELSALTKQGTWDVVPKSEATSPILPGTWVFRRKRTPDGTIKKLKGRYCVRGDLEEHGTAAENYAPVCSWSSVRTFLVLCITINWVTCSIDFDNAFVQAPLKKPVWIHVPRGFKSERGHDYCLRLNKSLYGLCIAPRLWYEHVSRALKELGFQESSYDKCLLYKKDIVIVLYVDDAGIGAKSNELIEELILGLRKKGFALTREASFSEFLGIKIDPLGDGAVSMTQKGLIKKILQTTGMEDCNPNWTPAMSAALGSDPDGPHYDQSEWNYASIVGMLLYLSTNTRPDIAFAVSQIARFTHSPRQSHATAVKMILRYLKRTFDKGTIVKPTGTLDIQCWVDADFCGLYKQEPDAAPISAKSRTGLIIALGGVPLFWKSQLQHEIALSTMESEYCALSAAMKTLIPIRGMIVELIAFLNVPRSISSSLHCTVFEDNNGTLILATNQRLTSRTKYFHVKWHFFWSHVKSGEILVLKIDTHHQRADYLTKGLTREVFERIRELVQGW
jgi:hypothetical protein